MPVIKGGEIEGGVHLSVGRSLHGQPITRDALVDVAPALDRRMNAVTRRGLRGHLTHGAKDAAQQGWVNVLEGLAGGRYNDSQHMENAGTVIAGHRVKDSLKATSRRRTDPVDPREQEAIVDEHASVEAGVEGQYKSDLLAAIVEGITPDQLRILLLAEVDRLPHDKIAEQLGTTPAGSRARLYRAKGRARRVITSLPQEDGIPIPPQREYPTIEPFTKAINIYISEAGDTITSGHVPQQRGREAAVVDSVGDYIDIGRTPLPDTLDKTFANYISEAGGKVEI